MRETVSDPKPDQAASAQSEVMIMRRELEDVVIKVNYHFSSGFERHVAMQTPESILLNFLKKIVKSVPSGFLYRICKKDFCLTMSNDGKYVDSLIFHGYSDKHDWRRLDDKLVLLGKAAALIDFEELKGRSHTLDKWYQVADKTINQIKDFQFK